MAKVKTQPAAMTTHTLPASLGQPELLEREWLLTNGTGAYSMGTAAGCNTRRYHGLLVPATNPPVGRIVGLNQVLERLHLPEEELEFTTCQFRDDHGQPMWAPHGVAMLNAFQRGLNVQWIYRWNLLQFTRTLSLHDGEQAATLRYHIAGLAPRTSVTLKLSPMLTLRDFHGLCHRAADDNFQLDAKANTCTLTRNNQTVTLACNCPNQKVLFEPDPDWWYSFHYPCDTRRGQEDQEDNFLPGQFVVQLAGESEATITLTAALGENAANPQPQHDTRQERLEPIVAQLDKQAERSCHDDPQSRETLHHCLAIASDDFLVARQVKDRRLSTILAGYPWFADWGRDTFIALPGLLLHTGRLAEARAVLEAFASSLHAGLVPNRFDDYDANAAHYNTVDASLWFVHAGCQYVQTSGDTQAAAGWLGQAMRDVLNHYRDGTMNNIHMDPVDGLIVAGDEHTQLTWMDAKCGDVVFTPRYGKAVEINALWYSGLRSVSACLQQVGFEDTELLDQYQMITERIEASFADAFWNSEQDCLFDHLRPDGHDGWTTDRTIRPNQVFAASLPYSPLQRDLQKPMLEVVTEHLLTPAGLRTLPEDDPNYHPWYGGDGFHRDEAYHQGTIWPWLIGPYAEAVLRTGDFSEDARRQALDAIAPLLDRMLNEGLGQLHEIHEAATLRPAGCIAQAWSVAEVLRVYLLACGAHEA